MSSLAHIIPIPTHTTYWCFTTTNTDCHSSSVNRTFRRNRQSFSPQKSIAYHTLYIDSPGTFLSFWEVLRTAYTATQPPIPLQQAYHRFEPDVRKVHIELRLPHSDYFCDRPFLGRIRRPQEAAGCIRATKAPEFLELDEQRESDEVREFVAHRKRGRQKVDSEESRRKRRKATQQTAGSSSHSSRRKEAPS